MLVDSGSELEWTDEEGIRTSGRKMPKVTIITSGQLNIGRICSLLIYKLRAKNVHCVGELEILIKSITIKVEMINEAISGMFSSPGHYLIVSRERRQMQYINTQLTKY